MSAALGIATRRSPLALWQARAAAAALARARDDARVSLVEVRSGGDRDQGTPLAGFDRPGVFTVEVDRAVLEGKAALAVHSLKDVTTTLPEGLVLAAVLERGRVQDVLVSREGEQLDELPAGARVATGSLRRRALLARARGGLEFCELRGNVDRRLERLEAGEAEALVLAWAGLDRLGRAERISQVLPVERFPHAVGQGIVGLVCREDDGATRERLAEVNHQDTWDVARAERALLLGLSGGCNVPVGVRTRLDPVRGELSLRAEVLSRDGTRCVAGNRRGPRGEAAAIGAGLAEELLEEGAAQLVEEARG